MTLAQALLAASLPLLSINADGSDPKFSRALNDDEIQTYLEIRLQYLSPTEYADLQQSRADKKQLRDEFQNTITQLQTIESATSPTNAQVIAAVKFLARTIRLLLKLLARTL